VDWLGSLVTNKMRSLVMGNWFRGFMMHGFGSNCFGSFVVNSFRIFVMGGLGSFRSLMLRGFMAYKVGSLVKS